MWREIWKENRIENLIRNKYRNEIQNVIRNMMASVLLAVMWLMCGCGAKQETVLSLERAVEMADGASGWKETEGGADANRNETAGRSTSDSGGTADGTDTSKDSMQEKMIYVHVCGAVLTPGVVEVPEGSRAQTAVEAAGGFREDADRDYMNLAAPVSDGEQLCIPTLEEVRVQREQLKEEESGRVNLNTADISRLCTLPGIGESRAGDIVAYRQEHGGFGQIEEIMKVPGIKESTFEKIKDLITVN